MEPEEWRTTGFEIGSWVLPHKIGGSTTLSVTGSCQGADRRWTNYAPLGSQMRANSRLGAERKWVKRGGRLRRFKRAMVLRLLCWEVRFLPFRHRSTPPGSEHLSSEASAVLGLMSASRCRSVRHLDLLDPELSPNVPMRCFSGSVSRSGGKQIV
jgi:hypothetical protein